MPEERCKGFRGCQWAPTFWLGECRWADRAVPPISRWGSAVMAVPAMGLSCVARSPVSRASSTAGKGSRAALCQVSAPTIAFLSLKPLANSVKWYSSSSFASDLFICHLKL